MIQIVIAHNSKYAVSILSQSDELFEVRGYDLADKREIWKKQFAGEFVRMNNIEQDIDGEVFGIAYQDCGKFFVTIFSPEGKEIDNVKVSTELNIDADSTPVSGFYEPLTTCCFLQDSKVLIAVYHRFNK